VSKGFDRSKQTKMTMSVEETAVEAAPGPFVNLTFCQLDILSTET
jgi:hypothetical protein